MRDVCRETERQAGRTDRCEGGIHQHPRAERGAAFTVHLARPVATLRRGLGGGFRERVPELGLESRRSRVVSPFEARGLCRRSTQRAALTTSATKPTTTTATATADPVSGIPVVKMRPSRQNGHGVIVSRSRGYKGGACSPLPAPPHCATHPTPRRCPIWALTGPVRSTRQGLSLKNFL